MSSSIRWTNSSVLGLAGGQDPVEAITSKARDLVARALDEGWSGPPFDPLKLADLLRMEVVAHADIPEARTVPIGADAFRIEYNPNRPRGRLRYSIAHEISHTLFADCSERVRNRGVHEGKSRDDWQLEALCNIAASEILMPTGGFPPLGVGELRIDHLLNLRRKFEVSTEALLIRATRLTDEPCAMFAASARPAKFELDYFIPSRSWPHAKLRRQVFPPKSLVADCTAIGFTAKGEEHWGGIPVSVECVGIPSYPGLVTPRVVGLVLPKDSVQPSGHRITYLKGSVLEPRTDAKKLIVHVVNDKTPNWGGRLAQALRKQWPESQQEFKTWAQSPGKHRLGQVHICRPRPDLAIASIVAQHGYGSSARPRIRYAALQDGLKTVTQLAVDEGYSLHMPRIGCGEAGGAWNIVEEIIDSTASRGGVSVTVYDLPGVGGDSQPQETLSLFP